MDALEKRATKIHDSILGMIGVVNSENNRASNKHARTLNTAALVFTTILLPFTIVPPIFNTLAGKGGPTVTVSAFSKAIGLATVAILGLFLLLSVLLEMVYCDSLSRPPCLQYVAEKYTNFLEVFQHNQVKSIKESAEKKKANVHKSSTTRRSPAFTILNRRWRARPADGDIEIRGNN